MHVVAGNVCLDFRPPIDRYVKKKLGILEDMCIITCDEDRIECRDRYYAAIKASDGDPHNAVDEEHYRILRMFL